MGGKVLPNLNMTQKTDRGEVVRTKVEKNFERKVKSTWNNIKRTNKWFKKNVKKFFFESKCINNGFYYLFIIIVRTKWRKEKGK